RPIAGPFPRGRPCRERPCPHRGCTRSGRGAGRSTGEAGQPGSRRAIRTSREARTLPARLSGQKKTQKAVTVWVNPARPEGELVDRSLRWVTRTRSAGYVLILRVHVTHPLYLMQYLN